MSFHFRVPTYTATICACVPHVMVTVRLVNGTLLAVNTMTVLAIIALHVFGLLFMHVQLVVMESGSQTLLEATSERLMYDT